MHLEILGAGNWTKFGDSNNKYLIEITSDKKNEIVIEYENNFVGVYFKAPDVINKRETFLSENGRFGIWYDSENNDWNLGFEEDMGTAKSIVYLDLDSESYFKSDRGFVFNSKGTELWEGKDNQELIEVTCSSEKGKSI